MKVKVAVRADASIAIGSGHVRRCLTLTDQFLRSNYEVTFFTRPNNGHLVDLIKSRGCHVRLLLPIVDESFNGDDCVMWPESYALEDARQTILCADGELYDWMIVDHYGIDSAWEIYTKGVFKHLLVIDDLANRQHDCNILVDQNLGRKSSHYQALLNEKAMRLCGSEYALLRPEFSVSRARALERREVHGLPSILIFMGGTDANNITCRVLEALWDGHSEAFKNIYVVMGSNAPSLNNVRDLLGQFNCSTELLIDTDQIHEYMMLSDISVGGAGGAAWESFLRDPVGTLGGDEKAFRQAVTNAMRGLTQRGLKRVAVATHGFPINVMLSELLTMDGLTNFTPHHGSVTRLHADEAGHLRVLSINEMTHITRDAH